MCDVPIHSPCIEPSHALVLAYVRPTIAAPDVTTAPAKKGDRTCERQNDIASLGKEHRYALVIAQPSIIAVPLVVDVGRQQKIEAVTTVLTMR